jgi:Divergent InlB B-repeat domain
MRSSAVLAIVLAAVVSVSVSGSGVGAVHGELHAVTVEQARAAISAGELPATRASARSAATWCGTPAQADLRPNTLSGYAVHWIYVLPSDAPDRSAAFASTMQTDAEAIDAWWRREDPTRVQRNDLTQLSCGAQLDLTSLRLSQSSSQLASQGGRFVTLFEALRAANFGSRFTKYIVYFDGPVEDPDVCGQGASSSSGIGVATVYVQACAGVSTAAVAVHEFLHTIGAVPRGAPHNCPEPNSGHTCDDPADLMHPFLDGSPLEAKVLDPGRDDYYGHSGPFADAQDSPWLVQLDRQQAFAVTISGPGGVTADVPGLDCARSCTTTWNASTRLGLSAVPRPGAKLVRWGGACRGAATCTVEVAPGATVSVLFAPSVYRLTTAVSGRGTVRSSRAGITCRPKCSAAFPSFTPLRLTAKPAPGWKLRSWTGACSGTRLTCTVPMTAATSARAVFVRA